jgi:hypothetical protein
MDCREVLVHERKDLAKGRRSCCVFWFAVSDRDALTARPEGLHSSHTKPHQHAHPAQVPRKDTHTRARTHHARTHTHRHTHARTHARTHTDKHTHTHTNPNPNTHGIGTMTHNTHTPLPSHARAAAPALVGVRPRKPLTLGGPPTPAGEASALRRSSSPPRTPSAPCGPQARTCVLTTRRYCGRRRR